MSKLRQAKQMRVRVVGCKVCGKDLEIVDFGDLGDEAGNYVHPECAEPLAVGSTAPSPRPLSELLNLAEDTIAYARRVLPSEADPDKCSPEQFAKHFVLTCFAHKILKSTEAVILLSRNGFGEDAMIITRSVVEAVINAARIEGLSPEEGVRRWGAYKIALQWRLYLRWKQLDPELSAGAIRPERVRELSKEFEEGNEIREWFLRDPENGADDPGNISKNWSTKRKGTGKLEEEDIYEMARKLDGIEQHRQGLAKFDGYRTLLRTAYDTGSDYAHSNPLAVEDYSTEDEDGKYLFHSSLDQKLVWVSLWSAIGVLIQMLRILDNVKPLGQNQELTTLFNRWIEVGQD